LKDARRVENEQSGMAPLIDFMRDLRNETGAAVGFVHHTGHTGSQMRGSSDLESAWETRLTFTRDGQSPLVKIESEHREAEAAGPIEYRIAWDHDTRSMRFNLEPDQLDEKVAAYLREHPDASANEVFKETGGNRPSVLSAVKRHREQSGTNPPVPLGTTPL